MSDSNIAHDLLENLGGVDCNDLNSILKTNDDHDDSVDTYKQSDYYDIASLGSLLQTNDQKFHTISLKIKFLTS